MCFRNLHYFCISLRECFESFTQPYTLPRTNVTQQHTPLPPQKKQGDTTVGGDAHRLGPSDKAMLWRVLTQAHAKATGSSGSGGAGGDNSSGRGSGSSGGELPSFVTLPCASNTTATSGATNGATATGAGSASATAAAAVAAAEGCHNGPRDLMVKNDPFFRRKLEQVWNMGIPVCVTARVSFWGVNC